MPKRESEDHHLTEAEKKQKVDEKKDDIAIDSELLGQQSSYSNKGKEGEDLSAAEVAAAAAVAAVSSSDGSSNNSHQQQHLQTAYQTAFRHQQQQQAAAQAQQGSGQGAGPSSQPFQPTTLPPSNKPQHGSDEWHRQRRENHKEVERRRREAINHGIKELAALIPTQDTNKAQILQRAVEYIKRLKENENNNIEKWTLEKLLTEQAVSELSASNDKLKSELERAYREIESWKDVSKK
ncbi:uncharacterized protein RJT20DRAFT_136418 [Scheffersomyces xylosifermentans]|uniref:uncharacterized protein n=1 Tax=Scheffersomyces xylosifermentans TaxID=1304137 RepID=UPI00315D1BB1